MGGQEKAVIHIITAGSTGENFLKYFNVPTPQGASICMMKQELMLKKNLEPIQDSIALINKGVISEC